MRRHRLDRLNASMIEPKKNRTDTSFRRSEFLLCFFFSFLTIDLYRSWPFTNLGFPPLEYGHVGVEKRRYTPLQRQNFL